MLKTRQVGAIGELQKNKSYTVPKSVGEQLVRQGLAVADGKKAESTAEVKSSSASNKRV